MRAIAPADVDLALDVAGNGILPELITVAGGAHHVLPLADAAGAREHGVRFSTGSDGRALHALADVGPLIESGRFTPPAVRTYPLTAIAQAHRDSEPDHNRAKIVLLVE